MITKAAKEHLGAKIIGHENIGNTIRLPSGLLKTGQGLIAPSKVESTEEVEDGRNESDVGMQQEGTHPEVNIKPVKRQRRKKEIPIGVRLTMTTAGYGSIVSTYAHYYIGNRVLILGLVQDSAIPPEVPQDATEEDLQKYALGFNIDEYSKYLNIGVTFVDKDNIKNIILIKANN